MTNTEYATFSNNAVMFAAIVYLLAFLSHALEWAADGRMAAEFEQQPVPLDEAKVASGPVLTPRNERATGPSSAKTTKGRTQQPVERRMRVEQLGAAGVALTILGALLQTAGLVTRGLAAHRVPWGNMYEFALAGTLGAVLTYILLLRRLHLRWLGLFVTGFLVTTLMATVLLLYVPAGPLVPALHSYWLLIHVTAAITATGGFTLGALTSALFLVRQRQEARPGGGKPSRHRNLPSAATIDRVSYRIHAFAFPVWTFAALIAGPIWAQYAWGRYWGWDPKEIWAFVTWVVYAGYLHARATAGWRGKKASIIAIIGFATVLFNFIGINLYGSGLHSYSGM